MFRSPSGFKVSIQALAAVLMATMLAVSSGRAQTTRKEGRDTNANRKLRAARQIKETYTHRWEVGGGGGYLRFRSGQYLQKNSEIAFWLDTTYYFNQKLGITGEFAATTATPRSPRAIPPSTSSAADLRVPLHGRPHLPRPPAGEGTASADSPWAAPPSANSTATPKAIPAIELGMWPSTNARPAFSVGANVDLNLFPNLAFRIAPNYMGTTFGGTLQNNLGVNLGLVYRFGRQK
jgi:hypothetical protein